MTLRLLVIRPPLPTGIKSVYSVQWKKTEASDPAALLLQSQLKIVQCGDNSFILSVSKLPRALFRDTPDPNSIRQGFLPIRAFGLHAASEPMIWPNCYRHRP